MQEFGVANVPKGYGIAATQARLWHFHPDALPSFKRPPFSYTPRHSPFGEIAMSPMPIATIFGSGGQRSAGSGT
jgi:hypothetical protein